MGKPKKVKQYQVVGLLSAFFRDRYREDYAATKKWFDSENADLNSFVHELDGYWINVGSNMVKREK